MHESGRVGLRELHEFDREKTEWLAACKRGVDCEAARGRNGGGASAEPRRRMRPARACRLCTRSLYG
eukprot:scaffold25561_cov112-Isochrysis_galbana.AAC.3